MSYVKPDQVVENMIQAGAAKANMSIKDMLIRGTLAGAILGVATTLAFTASTQSGLGILGAILFPVGFVIIVLLGLELVTGNFALLPVAVLNKKATVGQMFSNWFWVSIGHILGGALYGVLYMIAATSLGHVDNNAIVEQVIAVAEAKTLGYKALGFDGQVVLFVKAMLCNWLVTLGVVMGMTSKSTGGKIAAMWLPILIFFAQGFEHAVVNMFVIPAGMMLGADVSMADWWLWNQITVLVGNLVGGVIFTGLALYYTHHRGDTEIRVESPNKEVALKRGIR
ncbi:formate/nitrite transporter family protein [Aquibacillus kalidii]|uniref:formate/nitrite transporter family protein n=1 Tax=Aquibacillus kalidii TaxID=2762597 RepID=UPI001645383E|nr:formate/nitrite transporter family protein [Aquibacillus kalidii]